MKNLYAFMAFVLAIALLLMPLMAKPMRESITVIAPVGENNVKNDNIVKVKTDSGINEIELKEYLFGVVAAEMPALYHNEALKAQSVAAHTYLLYRKSENKQKDYDITDDFATAQEFITREQAKEKWGEKWEEYSAKIDSAVNETINEIITFGGKPILSVYTAISAGKTESSENVWGKAYDYLVPVESLGDMLCSDYLSSASFTVEQINEKLLTPNGITAEYTSWFCEPQLSDSGTVKSMKFGDASLSGETIRNSLELRSASFEVSFSDNVFYFSVRGFGHLCGMSQYGANYMAMQGSTHKEILEWYYKGCTVENFS